MSYVEQEHKQGVVEYFGVNNFNQDKNKPQFALKVQFENGETGTYYTRMDYCSVFPRKGERVTFKTYGRFFTKLKADYSHEDIGWVQ